MLDLQAFQLQAPSYFISDLHLQQNTPGILEQLIFFLKRLQKRPAAVYFLGDVFALWIESEAKEKYCLKLQELLKDLKGAGCVFYWLPGNRDFLFRSWDLKYDLFNFLPDPFVVSTPKRKVLLSHGDILCASDTGYLRYRAFVRNAWVQRLFRFLPGFVQAYLSNRVKMESKLASRKKPTLYYQIHELTVLSLLSQNDCAAIIHGHIHELGFHQWTYQSTKRSDSFSSLQTFARWSLGDWSEKCGNFLYWDGDRIQLCIFNQEKIQVLREGTFP